MSGGYPDISFGPLALVNFSKMSLYIGSGFYMAYTFPQKKYDFNLYYVDFCGGMGQEFRLGIVSKKHFYTFITYSAIYNYSRIPIAEGKNSHRYSIENYSPDPFDPYPIVTGETCTDYEYILNATISLHLGYYF